MNSQPVKSTGFHSGLGKSWDEIHQPLNLIPFKPTTTPMLPTPRKLMCSEVTETASRLRPVIEMTIQRRFLWFTWTEEYAIYGGEWLIMLAAGKVVRK
jgi:hypothetical protein